MSDENNDIIKGIFNKMVLVMPSCNDIIKSVNSDPKVFKSVDSDSKAFVCFANPGIPVSNDFFQFGDLSTIEQISNQAQFSYLVNNIPCVSSFWSTSNSMVWDVYCSAIYNIALPVEDINDTTEYEPDIDLTSNIEKKNPNTGIIETTTIPSNSTREYELYDTKYRSMLMKYNNMNICANSKHATCEDIEKFKINGPIIKNNLNTILEEWKNKGDKEKIENARTFKTNISGKGLHAKYNELRANFEMNKREDIHLGLYYPTFYCPMNFFDGNTLMWTKFNFSKEDILEYSQHNSDSWVGSSDVSYGLWAASMVGYNGNEKEFFSTDLNDFSMSAELAQIPIIRPWFDGSIFDSNAWKWSKEMSGQISDGMKIPSGMMPIVPVSVILARNIKIKMDKTLEKDKNAISKILDFNSCGFGPFLLKGNNSSKIINIKNHCILTESIKDRIIESSDMQIIGFVCKKISKSPNPDPNLIWP